MKVIEIREKSEDNTNGINNMFTEKIAENFPNIGKEINRYVKHVGPQIATTKRESLHATLYSRYQKSITETKF